MFEDRDIKIAGEKPSESVRKNRESGAAADISKIGEDAALGKKIGAAVADEFMKAGVVAFADPENDDSYMMMQRLLLLSFTVTVGLEQLCRNDTVAGIAQKTFLDKLKREAPELYDYTSDTGAFSFYFLAYRRGTEVVRRIGQTFAMLCSHDGDPIYQELGETLYCWFYSVIEKIVKSTK